MTGDTSLRTSLLPGAPEQAAVPAPPPAGGQAYRGPRLRTPVLVVTGAAVLVVAAVSGFVLVNNTGGNDVQGTMPAGRSPRTGSSAAATPSASATTTMAAPVPTGRNPFLPPGGAAPAGSAGSTSVDGGPGPSASAATSAASTVTTTVTASPIYVGLYGFSGSKAVFWVNDTKYQVAVGGSFEGFTYSAKTSSTCVTVTKAGTTSSLCSGTVKQFG